MNVLGTFFLILVVQICFNDLFIASTSRQYFDGNFKLEDISFYESRFIHFNDTMPSDSIFIAFAQSGNPVSYFRDVFLGVCMDGVCKPVSLRMYWTISGGFLGFSFERGEELTKKEHKPFEEQDYHKLHSLLKDPRSILANYSIYELAPKADFDTKSDGTSGATITSIAGYIVDGAAYTTHKLWHTTYGPTRDSILNISYDYVSPFLIDSVLEFGNRQDKIWALKGIEFLDDKGQDACVPIVGRMLVTDDPSLVEIGLNTISKVSRSDSILQFRLLEIFKKGNYGLKRKIINKLSNCDFLYPSSASVLVDEITTADPNMITLIIQLFKKRFNPNQLFLETMAVLLENKRPEVSEASYYYLASLDIQEKWLKRKLKDYRPR